MHGGSGGNALTYHADRDFQLNGWFGEKSGETLVTYTGTLRTVVCFERRRMAPATSLDQNLTCSDCQTIPACNDFKLRARRMANDGAHSGAAKSNNRYMSESTVRAKSAAQSVTIRDIRCRNRWLIFDLAATRTRVRSLKDRAKESSARGDVRKLIDDLQACARDGKFESKQVLLHFMMDAAKAVRMATLGTDGTLRMSPGMRWHDSTHQTFEVLKHIGGPRSHRWVGDNLIGMHERTSAKRWARGLHHYTFGLCENTFIILAAFYTTVLTKLGIELGQLHSEHSEDETAVLDEPKWNYRRDIVCGFCGPKDNAKHDKARKKGHRCVDNFVVRVGVGEEGYNNMVKAYQQNKRACYIRIIMINPLHEKVPSVIVMVQATCNCFTAADVAEQWDRLRTLYRTHLRHVLGVLIGPGSDGDARRFQLQLQAMTRRTGRRYHPWWIGFRLTGEINVYEEVFWLCAQDTFHCAKKLQSPMAIRSRNFSNGHHHCTWYHLELVGDPDLFDSQEHGMRREDIIRKDPMSVATVQRTCAKKVRHMRACIWSCVRVNRERRRVRER